MTRLAALDRTLLLLETLLRPGAVSRALLLDALASTDVTIVSDAANATTPAGQSAIVTLTQLVIASGCRVRLVVPDVALEAPQPPLGTGRLIPELQALASDHAPEAIVEHADRPDDGDVVFFLGDTRSPVPSSGGQRLVGGATWGGIVPTTETAPSWSGAVPIGALTAAAIAAAEPVKSALRRLPSAQGAITVQEVVQPTRSARFSHDLDEVALSGVDIGRVDVVSAGAITNAFLHGMLRLPRVTARLRVLDDDRAEISNLNRYTLLRRSQLGKAKTAVLRRYADDAVRIEAIDCRLVDAEVPRIGQLAECLVVGADSVPARWLAQRRDPAWLAVGATAGFMTLTSEHRRGEPCAGCLHPVDDDAIGTIPTISFVSYWAGLLTLARLMRRTSVRRCVSSRRALVLVPLRLDLPTAVQWQPVRYNAACPCAAVHTQADDS